MRGDIILTPNGYVHTDTTSLVKFHYLTFSPCTLNRNENNQLGHSDTYSSE